MRVVFCTIELRETETEMLIQSYNTVVVVAGDMKPGARVYKSRIPALQHIIWIRQLCAKRV